MTRIKTEVRYDEYTGEPYTINTSEPKYLHEESDLMMADTTIDDLRTTIIDGITIETKGE